MLRTQTRKAFRGITPKHPSSTLIEQVLIYSYTTYIMVPEISYRHFFLIFGAVVVTVSLDFTAAEGIFGGRFVLGRKWRGSSNPTGYTPLLLFRSNDKESKAVDDMVTDTAEQELGIHVQRLYPLRNENHRKLLEKLMGSDDIVLPYLYHRDSSYCLIGEVDDIADVRAWVRGKKPKVPSKYEILGQGYMDLGDEFSSMDVFDDDDMLLDLDDMDDIAKRGKQSILERSRKK